MAKKTDGRAKNNTPENFGPTEHLWDGNNEAANTARVESARLNNDGKIGRALEGPTKKELRYARARLSGKTQKASAEIAGYAHPKERGFELDHKQDVREIMRDTLQRKGLTLDAVADKLLEGLNAMKTQYFADKGIVTDSRTDADWLVREKVMRLVTNLQGVLNVSHGQDGGKIVQFGVIRVPVDNSTEQVWDTEQIAPINQHESAGVNKNLPVDNPVDNSDTPVDN